MGVMHPHCGMCAQCLQRRIATLGAGAAEVDPEEGYVVDLLLGPRHEGGDRAMAVDIIRSAFEYVRFSQEEFATQFASELAWLNLGCPDEPSTDVARKFVDLFKRHGNAVREIFVRATEQHATALLDKTLPESCLLRLAHQTPYAAHEIPPAVKARFLNDQNEDEVGQLEASSEVLIAVDKIRKQILIGGIAPLKASSDFRIVSLLVGLYLQDRGAGCLPADYRTMLADDLAEALGRVGDTAARKAVSRLRRKISREFMQLYNIELSLDAVIENVHGKGYRINPAVRVVAPAALAR
jgi:hypothetical protein